MKLLRILFGCLTCLLLYALSFAAVPTLVNFQGRLTDSLGNPQNGTFSIAFKIYDSPAGGNIVWQETQPSVTTTNGIFNVLLGSVTPVPDSIFKDTSRWLTIAVGTDPEVNPRARLSSSPYAFRVNSLDGALGGSIAGDLQTSGIVYSSSGGFKFPDGSVQTSASPGSFFQNTFRYSATVSVSDGVVSAFTAPSNKSMYITGIYVHNISIGVGVAVLLMSIAGTPIVEIHSHLLSGSALDGFWSSGGGAPILVQPNEVVTLFLSLANSGQSVRVLITGFEF